MNLPNKIFPASFSFKFLLKTFFLFLLILGVFSLFLNLTKKKIPPQTTSYREFNNLAKDFVGAKKEISEVNIILYSFKGNLLRMWFEKEVVVYEYDLGKGILLGQTKKVSLPLNILPFEYFGKKVAKKEELDLGDKELNLPSELKVWCKESMQDEQPCQVIKWAIYSLPQAKETGPFDEISTKVLAWLTTQKNEKGVYNLGQLCQIDGKCELLGVDNRCGLSAIWGRFKNFEKTNKPEELELIQKDLTTYTDPSKVPFLQNNFWNCKLMYEMWQSNLFPPEEKEKIEKICWQGLYPRDEGNPSVGPNLKEVLETKRFYGIPPTVLSDKGGELTEYAAYTSDFAARYLWKKDEKDLRRAESFFNKAISLYSSERQNHYIIGRCVLGIASLDIYLATSDPEYFDFAKSFWGMEEVGKICLSGNEVVSPNRCEESLLDQATCGLFAQNLYDLTKDEKYKDFKTKVVEKLIKKSWDGKDHQGEFLGDGAFYSPGKGLEVKTVNIYKPIRENGLMVGVLLGD